MPACSHPILQLLNSSKHMFLTLTGLSGTNNTSSLGVKYWNSVNNQRKTTVLVSIHREYGGHSPVRASGQLVSTHVNMACFARPLRKEYT